MRPRRWGAECLERRDLLSGTPPTVVEVQVASTQWSEDFLDYLQTSSMGTEGYSIPRGSSAQTKTLSWTGLDQIIIRFSEDVYVEAADMSLSGVNTTAYSFSDFHYDPLTHLATWTLSTPLERDRIRIDLDGNGIDPVRDMHGNVLDGEWTNNVSTVSGNGTAGGDFEFLINVLPGDVNATSSVMYSDQLQVTQLNGKTTLDTGYIAFRDIDGSGTIDTADRDAVIERLYVGLPGANPAGTNNDAPTSLGHDTINISNDAIDHVYSLTDWHADNESGGSGLTYSVVGNSDASLFDSVSINPTTKSLVLNTANSASGRAKLTIRATDPGGLFVDSVVYVDVNYVNEGPLLGLSRVYVGANTWIISGNVIDPDDTLGDFIVQFYGVFTTRTAVGLDGTFEFAVILEDDDWGQVWAWTYDPYGEVSNVVPFIIGLT
jgi:hypothetical protein